MSLLATLGAVAPPPAAGGWWTAGGATGTIFAFQAKGAASFAASKSNLANPGTHDLVDGTSAPTWDATNGWAISGGTYLVSDADASQKPCTMIARIVLTNLSSVHTILGPSATGGMQFRTETTSGNLRLVKADAADIGQSATGISASVDYVVAATYNGSGVYEFFVDGSSIGGGTNNQTLVTGNTRIGLSVTAEGYEGNIKAAAKYDNVLSGSTISAIASAMAAL